MKTNSKDAYYWYLVIGLFILVVIAKFFIDINNSKKSQALPKEYTAAALPLKEEFNKEIIEELQKKKIINGIELNSIKPYTSIISEKTVNINIEESTTQDNSSLNNLELNNEASNSGTAAQQ